MLAIIVITVVFDISEKIDDFIEKKAPLDAIIFRYYVNFVPYFITLFSSLFIFISVIFFTSKMAYQSEIIAILSSGISFQRFLYPYFVGACILAMFSFVLNDMIIPSANRRRFEFEETYITSPIMYLQQNVHKQIEPGLFVYMESFSNISEIAYRFSMEKYRDDRMVSKLMSDRAVWDKEKEKWSIKNYYIRDIDSTGNETLTAGASIDTTINLHPGEFKRRDNFVETMSIAELKQFIDNLRMEGADNVNMYVIEMNKRVAYPFSTFILTLIGVSLSTRKVRGGIGIQIAVGVAISFLYILFMQFSSEFATKGNLSPVLAAWIPNIIFGLIGIFLYRLAPK
jgi:lipopolysaccharide export system permease protein